MSEKRWAMLDEFMQSDPLLAEFWEEKDDKAQSTKVEYAAILRDFYGWMGETGRGLEPASIAGFRKAYRAGWAIGERRISTPRSDATVAKAMRGLKVYFKMMHKRHPDRVPDMDVTVPQVDEVQERPALTHEQIWAIDKFLRSVMAGMSPRRRYSVRRRH